jgi:hypothetical protein
MPSPISGKIRWTIYLLFAAAFFISAPIIVLYTAGYRYSLDSNRVVDTGVLSVKSYPSGADIYIDGEKQRQTTPAVIQNTLPGTHDIRLTRDGYTDWEKTLRVDSQATTFIDNATLFLTRPPRLIRNITTPHYAFEPNNEQLAYLQTEADWIELWIMQIPNKKESLLARLPQTDNASYTVDWSANGAYLSLTTKTRKGTDVTIVERETGDTLEVNDLVSNSTNFTWDAKRDGRFYVDTSEGLATGDVTSQDARLLPEGTISAVTIDGDRIIAQEAEQQTVIGKLNEQTVDILAYLPIGNYVFHSAPEDLLLLEDPKRDRVILLDATGGDRPILLNTTAKIWDWETVEGVPRLLYSDGFDLHIYDPTSHTDTTLTRVSEEITEVAWYSRGETVLYGRDDGLFSIEIDHRDRRNINTLLSGEISGVWVAPNGEYAYIFGDLPDLDGKGLYERRLQR